MERQGWASFILRCAGFFFCALLISIQQGAVDPAGITHSNYTTGIGEQKTVTMADGSSMQLNTQSRTSVEINTWSRAVTVHRGEVVLNVAVDRRPFVVHLGAIDFEATEGARAHVHLDPDGAPRVDVLAGEGWVLAATTRDPSSATVASVLVAAAGPVAASRSGDFQALLISAGSSFSLHSDVRIIERFDPSEMTRKLAWTRGQIVLAGEPLRDAVAEFNRYNRRQLIIGDESIASLSTGGTFYTTEPDTFTRSLNQLFGIHAVRMSPSGSAAAKDVLVLVGAAYSGL